MSFLAPFRKFNVVFPQPPIPGGDVYDSQILLLNPLGYWRLDDYAGTVATEAIGGIDGAYQSTPTFGIDAIDALGLAVQFDGTDSVHIDDPTGVYRVTGDLTVVFFINIQTLPVSPRKYFFQRQDGPRAETEAANVNYSLDIFNGTLRYFHEYGSGSNETEFFNFSFETGIDYHVVFVRDVSASQVKLYINGQLEETQTYNNQPTGGTTSTQILGLATNPGTGVTDPQLDCQMKKFAIFNKELTPEEITNLYALRNNKNDFTSVTINPIYDLHAIWLLNETAGTTWSDSNGIYTLTNLFNAPTFSETIPDPNTTGVDNNTAVRSTTNLATTKDAFSFAALIKIEDNLSQILWNLGTTTGNSLNLWYDGPNNRFGLSSFDSDIFGIGSATSSVADGEWHYIACTVYANDSSGFRLWIDGVESATSQVVGTTADRSLDNNFQLGGYFTNVTQYNGDWAKLSTVLTSLNDEFVRRLSSAAFTGSIDIAIPLRNCIASFSGASYITTTLYDDIAGEQGTINGATTGVSGRFGEALSFDGTNDDVTLSTSLNAVIETISLWFFRATAASTEEILYFVGDQSNGAARYISIDNTGINFNGWGGASFDDAVTFSYANSWTHVAFVFNGINKIAYINGTRVLLNSKALLPPGITTHVIGQRGDSANWFAGSLQRLRLYDRDLSEREIYQLSVEGNSFTYLSFDPDNTHADITLANNNLTVSTTSAAGDRRAYALIGKTVRTWAVELTLDAGTPANVSVGFSTALGSTTTAVGGDANSWAYRADGFRVNNNTAVNITQPLAVGQRVMILMDLDAGSISAIINGGSQTTLYSGLSTTDVYYVVVSLDATTQVTMNFGASDLVNTIPLGFNPGWY